MDNVDEKNLKYANSYKTSKRWRTGEVEQTATNVYLENYERKMM